MEINLIKNRLNTFSPLSSEDDEKARQISSDEVVVGKTVKKRNVGHHRKFFGLLKIVLENMREDWEYEVEDEKGNKQVITIKTIDQLLFHIKLQLRHFEQSVSMGGKIIFTPKSIAFDKMPQNEFEEFYDKAIDVCVRYFIDCEKEDLKKEVILNFG